MSDDQTSVLAPLDLFRLDRKVAIDDRYGKPVSVNSEKIGETRR
jgi:hypothetical protein